MVVVYTLFPMAKLSFRYGNESSNREWRFHSEPLSGRREQGQGLKFSSENENFKPRMKISCVGEWLFIMKSASS